MRRNFTRPPLLSSWRVFATALLVAAGVMGCGESIHDAALKGDVATMRRMLDAHPDWVKERNKLGKTPLHQSITGGNDQIILLLLERGADINAADNTGMTPLHVAAWWGTPHVVKLLLDHGAAVGAVDKFGDTPLHVAAMQGHGENCKVLLERGADLHAENREGLEPLDLAKRYNNEKTAAFLASLAHASAPSR